MSSYVEAVGNTQTIMSNRDIVFDTDADIIDIVGNDISVNAAGTRFTINRAGLYHVEWSINIRPNGTGLVVVGLLENNSPTTAISNSADSGSCSCGALISVSEADIPYTIRLHNFGDTISIENPNNYQNTAASIRILRFADGPKII